MRRTATVLIAIASAARADGDPPGTTPLRIESGQTAPIEAPPGTNILCDDPGVVAPEFAPDGNSFLLRAKAPGETLCGVWLAEAKPGGLYRVTVVAARAESKGTGVPAQSRDGGAPENAADAGSRDAGVSRRAVDAGPAP